MIDPKILFGLLVVLCLSSCNLFNPSGDVTVDSDDANALIYEGQLLYRDGEYEKSARYFSKAIKADSTKSEAWFGLAKASMHADGVDPFEMIPYINVDDGEIPFMNMDTSDISHFYTGIRDALLPLRELVRRDTLTEKTPALKLSDRKVTYSNFSVSYAFLEFAYILLGFRQSLSGYAITLTIDTTTNQVSLNIDSLYTAALSDTATLNLLNTSIDTLSSNIDQVIDVILPTVTDLLDGTNLLDSTQLSDTTNVSELVKEVVTEKAEKVGSTISFYKLGDKIDNDGDGCIDEEILDGKDNDGDGFVDEDLRLVPLTRGVTSTADLDYNTTTLTDSEYGVSNYDNIIYIGIGTDSLDHDMDKVKENVEERTFLYPEYTDRVTNQDYRLLFSKDFSREQSDDSTVTNVRIEIMSDTDSTNIHYSLEQRKDMIGRCWNNYDEEMFKAWFRGR
ncbi:MAG: tetratricopeptide repeat protein [Fibrobacteraceae bacterium]|nr:tetratricopeptide repeat protein [Fibrobacteraceae bacterium]